MTHLTIDGSIDCHLHVFEPEKFPYAANRSYTPGAATHAELVEHVRRMGTEKIVLVQPSVYGTDNSALLAELAQWGEKARAIVVIDPETISDQELEGYKAQGVVGFRLNKDCDPRDTSKAPLEYLELLMQRAAQHGMMVQLFMDYRLLEACKETIINSPVPVILDHFGGMRVLEDGSLKGYELLHELMGHQHLWLKLSGPQRVMPDESGWNSLGPAVRKLVRESYNNRIIWASDWPHTGGGKDRLSRKNTDIEPFRVVDDDHDRAVLEQWVDSTDIMRQILKDNPSCLFEM